MARPVVEFAMPPSPSASRATARRLTGDERGVAVVELALTMPILLAMLMGIVSFGDYFLTAHMVQQAANDAARAALAGIDAAERKSIATDTALRILDAGAVLRRDRGQVTTSEANNLITVSVRYDASTDPLLNMPFVPTPGKILTAKGVAMLGGL
ncbi:TadE/TadG family type IV pilus assembly protein [Sphingomonas sp. Leaf21]|uniref:TadE/TadG family type IV pilus assembly protein n=1 Tax=Sphingomonas sp. Leaf21 TaxID=2876550 RepID=UPI001E37A17E|nr:TadE family protein [Sphingomonas sp. Leaf21]